MTKTATVEMVTVSYDAPKELNDFRVLFTEFVDDVKAGKNLEQLAAENFPALVNAIQGADQIPEAVRQKLKESVELAGHMGGQIVGSLLGDAVVQTV